MDGPLQGPPTCRTRYAKVVVTDDQGRYVVPDLPKAKYKVWVRGYGLVDSPKVDGEPGKQLNLRAVPPPRGEIAIPTFPPPYPQPSGGSSRAVAGGLLILLIKAFVPSGAPVVIGLDDTIERRWGAKISARGIYRDPVPSSKGHFVKANGLR